MQKETTGRTISRLGVLTVLAHNFVEENRLTGDELAKAKASINDIRHGRSGVSIEKVTRRSVERCFFGVLN